MPILLMLNSSDIKFLIDISEKIELIITSTSQEDMVGGRRAFHQQVQNMY